MRYNYPVLLYPDPSGGFVAEVPQLKGCLAQGETEIECLNELDHVIELWLETARDRGIPLPNADTFVEQLRKAVNS